MANRIRPGMVEFAKAIGAMNGGRPNWYLVAEELAKAAKPELLEEEPSGRGPGRPQDELDFFAMEVHRVMSAFNCKAKQACRRLAKGGRRNALPVPLRVGRRLLPDGLEVPAHVRFVAVGSPWEGENAGTLEQRYIRWKKREEERQKKFAIEIP